MHAPWVAVIQRIGERGQVVDLTEHYDETADQRQCGSLVRRDVWLNTSVIKFE